VTLCRDCQDLGLQQTAMRMVGKTPVCDQHCASRMGTKWTPPTPLSLEAQAARLVASGLNARDTASALANLGFPKKRAEKAVEHATGIEQTEVGKEKAMQGRRPRDLDWAQVQRERDAGASVEELRKKYKTSWPTVNKYTSAPNGKRHAGGGKNFEAHSPRRSLQRSDERRVFGPAHGVGDGCSLERTAA
jgi:hypothetical protein